MPVDMFFAVSEIYIKFNAKAGLFGARFKLAIQEVPAGYANEAQLRCPMNFSHKNCYKITLTYIQVISFNLYFLTLKTKQIIEEAREAGVYPELPPLTMGMKLVEMYFCQNLTVK